MRGKTCGWRPFELFRFSAGLSPLHNSKLRLSQMERLTVGIGADGRPAFVLPDGREVVLLGGNYVVKGPPYFPPLGVVEADAKAMADGARAMEYKPSAGGREVRACVRLGCIARWHTLGRPGSMAHLNREC